MKLKVKNPYNDEIIEEIEMADKDGVDRAIDSALKAYDKTKNMPSYKKHQILSYVSDKIKEKRDEFAKTITLESGKPLKASYREVDRTINTFRLGAEETSRLKGEYLPLDITEAGKGRFGIVKRFPIGPIAAISPFNFPLNLVAHKISPAIAAGNPMVLKPSSKTPLSALKLARIISETDWPKGALSVVVTDRDTGDLLVTDRRFAMLTFTGSAKVGWLMKKRVGVKKKVTLELGGNAGLIIDKSSNLDFAAKRALMGAFSYSGQSCISVQRMYVHQDIFDQFVSLFVKNVQRLKVGDPMKKDTDLGPMIDKKAATRTKRWINEARGEGAKILTGGEVKGKTLEPTVIINADSKSKVCTKEAFAPLVVVFSFTNYQEVLEEVNDSVYGLQAGIFTNSHDLIWRAFERLDVGGVIVNDVPTFRVDNYPYGGVKKSGFGREGVKYAIEDMTEIKILVVNRQQE